MIASTETIVAKIEASLHGKDCVAFVEPDGAAMSYGAMLELVAELSDQLEAMGVRPGEVVGLVTPHNLLGLISFLAISSIAICCPICAHQRLEEVSSALEEMGVSTLIDAIGDPATIDAAVSMGLNVSCCRLSNGVLELTTKQSGCWANIADIGADQSIALLMRTSGTTSKPKLVGLSHSNVIAAAFAIRDAYDITESDFCFNLMPLYHVHGLISAGMSSLLSSSRQMCTGPLRSEDFADAYARLQPTWFTGLPPEHLALWDYYERNDKKPHNDRLRFFGSSSAPLPASAIAALEKLFGAPLLENYGMTETASTVCSNLLPPAKRKVGGVGSSISAEIKIVDDNGAPVPRGDEGEILLRGPCVITHYLAGKDINAKHFDAGWLKTGDVGYFDEDRDLFVVGRNNELIKRGGESVYPSEIDNALSAHNDISEAVTFAIEHPTLGEDLIAVVVLKEGVAVTERQLRDYLADELSTFKAPSKLLIIEHNPKNETGKIQRHEMAD